MKARYLNLLSRETYICVKTIQEMIEDNTNSSCVI